MGKTDGAIAAPSWGWQSACAATCFAEHLQQLAWHPPASKEPQRCLSLRKLGQTTKLVVCYLADYVPIQAVNNLLGRQVRVKLVILQETDSQCPKCIRLSCMQADSYVHALVHMIVSVPHQGYDAQLQKEEQGLFQSVLHPVSEKACSR